MPAKARTGLLLDPATLTRIPTGGADTIQASRPPTPVAKRAAATEEPKGSTVLPKGADRVPSVAGAQPVEGGGEEEERNACATVYL